MKYAYSTNEESYNGEFDTPEEAAQECFEENEDCDTCHVGEIHKPKPENGVDAYEIMERIIEQREEQYSGDWAEQWVGDMTDWKTRNKFDDLTEAMAKAMADWLDKHNLRPTFYNVENVKTYKREDIMGDA